MRPTPASATNLLFFDRHGPTREVWNYEQPLPQGRKNYTIQFEEFAPLVEWWGSATFLSVNKTSARGDFARCRALAEGEVLYG